MDDVRIGIRFRALRHRLGWRQEDLAARVGVSQDLISLVERGRLEEVALRNLRRIARELDAEYVCLLRWRGGDLDRLVDEGHARLVGVVTEMLLADDWHVRLEVSYAVYRERGSIDILAWHPQARILLVVEVKSELVAVEETLRQHDEKARIAPRIAAEPLCWRPVAVARLLVLPSRSTQRRQVERHAAVMSAAYPLRGLAARRWLTNPIGSTAGLLFLELERHASARTVVNAKRIRRGHPKAA
ncbi:MAG TPA: helix-turn-helix transcriptional regulator [Candidatus Deferrimicrobiaceae bacterium]|nr:helix-turn-helix transcriptional regulator [Candidatus Deferrimicrobiaceae bacterium]